MSTILTDDEIATIWADSNPSNFEFKSAARAVEAAVLAKLAQQADRQRVPDGYVQERKIAAQLAEELARQMYRQHPTYRGVTPLLWENAPSEVRAEWVQKASAMLAAAPEAPEAPSDHDPLPTVVQVPQDDDYIERIAVKHEAFGFGQVDAKGFTTHGFDPDGLRAFVREILAAPEASAQTDRQRVPDGYVQERKIAAQLAEELARQMYRQHPTYRGVTPLLWENAPSEVRAEWVQKASAMLAAAPEAPVQGSAVDERAAFEAWALYSAIRTDLGAWEAWEARAAMAQKGSK